jgi:hypothetical protein
MIMLSPRQFGYKIKKLSVVELGKRGPQNHLLTAVAKVAA